MKHRREQNEILATDQRYLNVVATGQRLVEMLRCVKSAESATGNNDFGFHQSVVLRFRILMVP